MPVQSNVGIQNNGTVVWDGTTHRHKDIRPFVRFGFVFEVIAALAADVVFKFQAAPADEGSNCNPGAFEDVQTVAICSDDNFVAGDAEVTIPAGTPIGTTCAVTLPCRPGAFIRTATVSGAEAADVRIVLIRQGPRF